MPRSLLLLVLGAALAVSARAQTPVPLTLERAVELATREGPAAQAAAGARALAVGRARADAQWVNPTLELRRENEGAPIPYDDFATLTLPVSLTGRRLALRDALSAARVRGLADSLAVMQGARFGAARAWWDAWAADVIATTARAQATRFAELARFDSLRAGEGAVAEAAALRTRLEADRAAFAAAQAIAAAARARGELAARLGLDDARTLTLAAPAAADPIAEISDDDASIRAAIANRPDVMSATAAAREADHRSASARRGALPDVGLSGGYKGTSGYATAQFGVILTPPLLHANGGAREESHGAWLLADAERRATELRAIHDVRAALEAVRAMDAATATLDAGLLARSDTIALAADAAYREGAATLTETLEALRAISELRIAGVRALAERALVRLDLRRALGAPVMETP